MNTCPSDAMQHQNRQREHKFTSVVIRDADAQQSSALDNIQRVVFRCEIIEILTEKLSQ